MSLLEKYYTDEHKIFRESVVRFYEEEITPNVEQWEIDGIVPRKVWKKFGDLGFLCSWLPEEYGGVEADFLFSYIVLEEMAKTHFGGFGTLVHSDVTVPYIFSYAREEQKKKWLPKCASGDLIAAIAMTEPDTGSDLASIRTTAIKDGDHYVINGQKTFISNGINSDLVVLAAKTDPKADPPYTGVSLIVVEAGTPGFEKGKNLDKMGLHSQDTAELSFVDCRVPVENILGDEGNGFLYLMEKLQRERLALTIASQTVAEEALKITVEYAKERVAFGRPISRFQYNSFELAKMATEIEIGKAFLETLIIEHMDGKDIVQKVSMAKYWISEMLNRVVAKCVQLHGGYGFMEEYPITRMYRDSRVQTIVGGTSEIMLLIISRNMGL